MSALTSYQSGETYPAIIDAIAALDQAVNG
jgi:hypothetical protein